MGSLSDAAARRIRLVVAFLAAYGAWALNEGRWSPLQERLFGLLPHGLYGPIHFAYTATLFGATLITILAVVGRALGARRGSWALAARAMPTLVNKVLHWVPGGIWFLFAGVWAVRRALPSLLTGHSQAWAYWSEIGVALGALGMTALTRFAIQRAVSAVHEELPTAEPVDPAETVFSAVAVTWTTRAAVGALAVLPIAFVTAMLQVNIQQTGLGLAVAAYVATAFGSIALLRRVSRIKVGIDGVYVMGSGPATFTAWSNLDEVRAEGVDIVLRRRGRVILRLQLHGADAARSDALVVRFADAMAAAASARTDASHVHAAHAASAAAHGSDRFLASVHGAGDYRKAAVNREQLWEVVEGPAADPSARVLAAEALADTLNADDRARLRVAAEHCAEPRVRVALEELLDDEESEREPATEPARHHL